jgi:hypothetical protein
MAIAAVSGGAGSRGPFLEGSSDRAVRPCLEESAGLDTHQEAASRATVHGVRIARRR